MSYPTVNRRLPVYAGEEWQARLTAACATRAKLGPASLVLFDVSTLLCRHRHNNVYADHWVMPMSGAPLQVKALRIVRQAGSGKSQGLFGAHDARVYQAVVLADYLRGASVSIS